MCIEIKISDMYNHESERFRFLCRGSMFLGIMYPATMWAYCSRKYDGEKGLSIINECYKIYKDVVKRSL